MEIAPLDKVDGSYDEAPASSSQGKLADTIWAKIDKKAKKYGQNSKVHLLLYSTDWKFRISEGVLNLLAYQSLRHNHPFKSISYYCPDDLRSAIVHIVYPRPVHEFQKFNESSERKLMTIKLNIAQARIVKRNEQT